LDRSYRQEALGGNRQVPLVCGIESGYIDEQRVLPIEDALFKSALSVHGAGAFLLKAPTAIPFQEGLKG
jgi:hypothetical protein